MSKLSYLSLFIIVFLLSNCEWRTENNQKENTEKYIYGKVIGISDGDTYHLLTKENKTLKIRMEGIDAPEREMPFYKVSKDYLSHLIYKKEVKVLQTGTDVYDRILGFTYLTDETDVNLEMLKAGLAWHFKRYNSDKVYADAEKNAQAMKMGLWTDSNPVAPWEYRRKNREHSY